MKRIAALACLLLVSATGCGEQAANSEPSPQAGPANAPAAATPAADPAPAAAPTDSAPAAAEANAIAAGEELESVEEDSSTARANTLLAAAVAPAAPEPASNWQQGVNYKLLVPAQPTNAPPDKVEVVEVFWYGCSHCYALDPYLENWKSKKAPYVQFTRVPVTWGPVHRAHAKLFYTLAALGKGEELHAAVFNEIQQRHNMLASNDAAETEQMQLRFARAHGISEEEFRNAYNSMSVDNNLRRAELLTRNYRVEGVPLMVVNGKYTADVGSAGDQNKLIALINDLAAREAKK